MHPVDLALRTAAREDRRSRLPAALDHRLQNSAVTAASRTRTLGTRPQAALLAPALQDGLRTRLAYAEAAGWLAAQGFVLHPVDLALRAAERFDRRDLYARATARPRAAFGADELWLPLGGATAGFDAQRFAAWRERYLPAGRGHHPSPALLRAAAAAADWMASGITAQPTAAQALAAAHLVLQRTRLLRCLPLLVWAGWPALGAPLYPHTLPRLRGDVAARLQPDPPPGGPTWAVVFLAYVAEAARAGLRTLAVVRDAAAAAAALAASEDRRSRLPAALDVLLQNPAVTAASLARTLGIPPQAALRLLDRLGTAGLLNEVTGRKSFRVFALGLTNQSAG